MEIFNGILQLLAGLGAFMAAMKIMTGALEGSLGKSLRKLFDKISNNRFLGVGVGTLATAAIQSSTAITVMTVGFVNAGIMTLFQATAIIMGANVGTCITAFLVSLNSLNISLYMSFLSFIGVFIKMFTKNPKAVQIANLLIGLGIIFIGLSLMSSAMNIKPINEALGKAFSYIDSPFSPIIWIIFGLIFTAVVQSSSAINAIVIAFVGSGVLRISDAIFLIMGTNVGTCVTAMLSSAGTNTNAKRAALIHLLFNVLGTVVFLAIIWPLQAQTEKLLHFLAPNSAEFQMAYFHLLFNVLSVVIMLPFIKQFVFVVSKLIKDKPESGNGLRLEFIDDRILHTPPIAVSLVLKEVMNMAGLARVNFERGVNAVLSLDISDAAKLRKDEQKIDFINKGIARYLVKMSSLNLPAADEKLIGSLHHVISDIERIGDHSENFMEEAEAMAENNLKFSDTAKAEIKDMYDKICEMFTRSLKIFEYRDLSGMDALDALEAEVDLMKKRLESKHIARLNKGECSVESGAHFYTVIISLERVADHLVNIAVSTKNKFSVSEANRRALKTKSAVKL